MLLIACSMMIILAACSDGSEEPEADEANETTQEGSLYPLTLEDARGTEFTLEEQPEKIISLLPSNTEMIYSLDAWDQLIAVTGNDDYPPEANELPTVGDMTIDVEETISQNPDVVLAGQINDMDAIGQIEEAGIPVVVIEDTNSFEDLYDTIEFVGTVLGKQNEAEVLINDMQARIESIEAVAQNIPDEDQLDVWVEVDADPDLFTTGSETFVDEMLTMIGANNVAHEEVGWVQYTEEDAISLNPNVIIITYGAYIENSEENVLNRAAWQSVPAVEDERVYSLDDANTVSRQGPRLIEGVETLAELIYPEYY